MAYGKMDDETKRRRNSIDTFTILEHDALAPSAEEIAEGELGFVDILRNLENDRQRFIALALYQGWNKLEIARILKVAPPDINFFTRRMQMQLAIHRIRYKKQHS